MTPHIDVTVLDNIGFVCFDNPKKRNAFSKTLVNDMIRVLHKLKNQKIPVVILHTKAGASVWSAGSDIREMPSPRHEPLGYQNTTQRLLRTIQEYPGAVIAMVHGSAYGAAFELILTCDIAVGDETSSFVITPMKLALPYNVAGILRFINRMGLNIAKELFFTAEPMSAERAERIGILNFLVPSSELREFTMRLAKRIASMSVLAIAVTKEQFRLLAGSHSIVPDEFERIQDLRRRVYESHDYEEGLKSFLEKRTALFRGE